MIYLMSVSNLRKFYPLPFISSLFPAVNFLLSAGNFSFASPESDLLSSSVLELVQKGVTYRRHHPYLYCLYLYCLNPRSSPVPVRLLFPVNRSVSPSSLRTLCQSVIDGQRGNRDIWLMFQRRERAESVCMIKSRSLSTTFCVKS